ncbi:hypothetical protein [Candidatus Mycobacterium methanotrophicum]|uniref:Uncharacterized protein n=1 Tax=Candidatus Mycobacterium methanotrophicum TaxID=2943498 RepID=A0ABY4QGS3_9MYCO|nr:hypothetical protein [Candidatus Mycobacterium methanotrophicum]UQX10049.1 hypothetical protein M5I08_17765 [Candidatus Mycobacterium methanotrophicum]
MLSSADASNAASTAVTDNVESALRSGDSTAMTDLENAGTTVLYAYLNGYPDAVGSGNDLSPDSAYSPTPPTARPPASSTVLRRSATPSPTRCRRSVAGI